VVNYSRLFQIPVQLKRILFKVLTVLLYELSRLVLLPNSHNTLNTMYVATLPCNLSLRACFADINVSQGSVPTYARWGEIFNMH